MMCVCCWAQLQRVVQAGRTCKHWEWTTKKLKLNEEAISKILVADTDSESGAEVSYVEEEFEEEEEEEDEQRQEEKEQLLVQQASAQDKPQAATSGRGLLPWGQPQGRNTNVHPFTGPA